MFWSRPVKVWPLLLLFAVEASALERRDVGIFFDAEATLTSRSINPMEPFGVFVVTGPVLLGGLDGYEFLVDVDPRVPFVSETVFPAGSSDFGVDPSPLRKNYIVGTGLCIAETSQEVLVQLTALVLSTAEDLLFCLEAAVPSLFSPPRPGYLGCGTFEPENVFSLAYQGCAVANPVTIQPPVAIDRASWGTLKSRF